MSAQRFRASNTRQGLRPRGLAAALVALLTLLLSALLPSLAFAAPAPPVSGANPSPSAAAGSTAAPGAQGAQATWSIQASGKDEPDTRPTFSYKGFPPGASIQDYAAIRNFGSKPLTLALYASDAFNTKAGGFDVLPAAQKPVDVGSWIRTAKSSVTVAGHATVIVPFTVTVPRDATPGFHVGGIVASLSSATLDAKGDTVRVDRRVGMRVFLQVSGALHPTLAVKNLTVHYQGGWDPIHPGTATVTWTVANTGNVPLHVRQDLATTGLFGAFATTAQQPQIPLLLPGNSVRQTVKLSGIWPGGRLHTTVRLLPDSPLVTLATPAPSVTAAADEWAMPWTWLISALLVLTALGLWTTRRLRRRQARSAAAGRQTKAADTTAGSVSRRTARDVSSGSR